MTSKEIVTLLLGLRNCDEERMTIVTPVVELFWLSVIVRGIVELFLSVRLTGIPVCPGAPITSVLDGKSVIAPVPCCAFTGEREDTNASTSAMAKAAITRLRRLRREGITGACSWRYKGRVRQPHYSRR